jgi:thioredoxin
VADIELTDASFDKEVLQSSQPVVVDLWAPWCGPCRMLTPVIEELAKEYAGKVKVAKLNTDDNTQTAMKYKISAIPTLLFAKGGKIVDQMVGVYPKAEIKKKIDSLL